VAALSAAVSLGCGFESRRRNETLSAVIVALSQVELLATGLSLIQRSPTDCGVSECNLKALTMRKP